MKVHFQYYVLTIWEGKKAVFHATFPHYKKKSIFFFCRLGAWGSKSMCRIDFPFIIFIDLHGVTTVGPYCTAYTVRVLNVKVSEKYRVTLLQKLSKCEFKAWLCWNSIILLPLRFYVTSKFWWIQMVQKCQFCQF